MSLDDMAHMADQERKREREEGMDKYTQENWPADRWPNFSFDECKCKQTGECFLDDVFMSSLQALRTACGFPLQMTSVYRHPTHTAERTKPTGPGAHSRGEAGDISCTHSKAYKIMVEACKIGFTGIFLKQHGDTQGRFIHLDTAGNQSHAPRPHVKTYK